MTVTDALGCSISSINSVTEPLPISAIYTTDSVSCFGGSDGQIQVTTTGGTQPYILTITPGATTNNTGLFTGLTAGSYTVNIVDSNGCPLAVGPMEVHQPTQVLFTSVNTVDVTCFGDSTGEISVTAAGGTGNISFTLSPNIGTQSPSGNFTGLAAITYIVTATDDNNCSTTTSVTINQNPEIRITSFNFIEPTCHGDSNGSLSFTAIGGVGGLQYAFNGSAYNSDTSHTNLGAGTYPLSIQDALGCVLDTSLTLTEPDPVGIASYELTPTTCDDSEDGKIVLQASGGRPYYTYYRRPGISFNQSGIFYDLKKGVYNITIVDSSGCEYDTTFNVLANPNSLQTSITKTDLPCKGYGNEGTARVDVLGGVPPFTYLWSSTPASMEAEVRGLRFGYYFVEVLDGAGCKVTDTTYINPGDCCTEVFLPNAFSPNGDGRNDEFRVLSTAGIELRQFEIFNRWGQKVWQTYTYSDSWNGKFKGEDQAIGDFYYVFRYKCLTDRKEYIRKGNLTLIR
jgi:gliding motility-associated-like protein